MAKLVKVPLGCTARQQFVRELEQLPFGEGVLVLPNNLLMNDVRCTSRIETIGLDTLANKILNINGYINFKEISRRTQELIVQDLITYMVGSKNLQQLDKDKPLSYFGKLADKTGFVKAMTSLVGQLSRSGATEREIISVLDGWGREGALGQKDEGVRNLYLLYRQYLKNNNWFDLEGKYRLALRVLEKDVPKLIWKKIYFCDFYSFDKLQLQFIKKLAQHAEVTIGMTYEAVEPSLQEREKIFAASKATYYDLLSFCEERKLPEHELKTQNLAEDIRQLRLLGLPCFPIAAKNVHTYKFTNRDKEMRWVLAQVKRKLQEGMSASKILVAVRDLNTYSGLRLLADEYGIPVNLPRTTTLSVQPFSELLRLLLAAVSNTHDGALAYFRLLASELLPLLMDVDLEAADNLREEFYFSNRSEAQQKVHEMISQKAALWQQMDDFIADTKEHNSINDFCAELKNFIVLLPLEERLGALYKKGILQLEAVAACLRARDAYVEMLRQLQEDYVRCKRADEKISLSEWQELLAEATQSVQLVLEQGRADGVLITSVVNVQGLAFDSVYLMGLREGEFPKADNENWIYNDRERSELAALGVELPGTALSYAEDACFFAMTVAAAQREVYLTWFEEENVGASIYVEAVSKLFDNLQAGEVALVAAASPEELERLGMQCDQKWLAQRLGEEAMQALAVDAVRKSQLESSFNGVIHDAVLAKEIRKNIGSSFSASMLEIYAQCPFRYLGERIWREQLFVEKEDALQPADEGSLLHMVLARFVGGHLHEKITQQPLDELMEELELVFADVCQEFEASRKIVSSKLWTAEQPRLLRLLKRWLNFEYTDQMQWSNFTPAAVEWDFSSKNGKPLTLTLSDNSEIALVGRLDRIDSDGEKVFVTDYKRSNAPYTKDLWKGFDLQLPVYLLAVAERFAAAKKVCGGTYFVLKDMKRKSALVLEDVGNVDLSMPKKPAEEQASWESFANFCEKLLQSYIEAIYQGNFIVEPKRCDKYCQMKNICRWRILAQVRSVDENE